MCSVLYLSSLNWFVLNPVFSRVCRVCSLLLLREIKADGRKLHSIILSYFTKKQRLFFIVNVHNKSRPFTIPIIFMTKRVATASTVGRGINPV